MQSHYMLQLKNTKCQILVDRGSFAVYPLPGSVGMFSIMIAP
ncbi:MAG: hypothetical protein Q8Q67_01790 [bacterium]|nr:hypothetical protein [bacterium]